MRPAAAPGWRSAPRASAGRPGRSAGPAANPPHAETATASGPRAPRITAAGWLAHGVCLICLCLQRFGASFEHGQQLFLSVLAVPPLVFALLVTKRARIDAGSAALYLFMTCCFLISSVCAILYPFEGMRFSILSICELLLIYAVLLVQPARGFKTDEVFKVFVFYARLIAVLAIVQYGLQFVGVRAFSFTQLAPALKPVLTEVGYHVVAPITYGSPILRSNGFFLLEPSILSQIIAIGVVVDYFILSRPTFLPVYAVAALISYSGTGVLALGLTLLFTSLVVPGQWKRAALVVMVVAVVTGAFALLFPAEFATVIARASGSDPSSKLRYAAQWDIFKTILDDTRVIIGFGPGSSDGYVNSGSMSAALKLFFDYGLIGIVAFTAFLIKVVWRSDQPMIAIICLINFQFGGGYLVFSPFIFLMALLCIWSKPVVARRLVPRRRVRTVVQEAPA